MLIGELSERSGVSARMLRHYDSIGLVSPRARTHGGYRRYSEEDIRRLFHVEALRALGLGLREIADALGDLAFNPEAMVETLIVRTRERLAREKTLLCKLSQVQASEPNNWSDVLHTIGLMRGLDAEHASERQRFALTYEKNEGRNVFPVVEAALTETDPNAAGAFDWALAQTGDAAVPFLAEALDSAVASRRHRATEGLRKIGSPRASEALAAATQHADPLVRGRAALERGMRGEADAVPALLELIVDGRDDVDAADVLADLATRHDCTDEIADAIVVELADATDVARRRLAATLAGLTGPKVETILADLIDDTDRRVAITASFLLKSREPNGSPARSGAWKKDR